MKFLTILLLLFFACNSSGEGSQNATSSKMLSTEHFTFSWEEPETTPDEIDAATVFCEDIYDRLAKVIGEEKMPTGKIEVRFRGEGLRPNGRKIAPNVDALGRVNLYRFRQGGYLDTFAHELVHAVRINRVPNWERFFEEGFASAIADLIFPEQVGFPLFGYERSKITSYLMQQDYFITLSEVKSRHSELNLRCQLQTYIPREDFFCYLRRKYGIDQLLEFSNSPKTNEIDLYEEVWGKSFAELEDDWMKHTLDLHSKNDVEQTGSEYFEKTSARYIPICR